MKKDLIKTIKIITLGLLLSGGSVFAWTIPVTLPPTASQTADISTVPINQGIIGDSQLKDGGLAIGPLTVAGNSSFYGHVSIFPCSTCSTGTGSGGQLGVKHFDNIFSSLGKNTIIKSFDNFFSSLLKTDMAYASIIVPSGPNFNYVYPQGTFDSSNQSSPYYPDGNTQYPIAYYSGTPPNDMFIASTGSAAPSFKVYTDKAGVISFTGGCSSATTSIPISTSSAPTTIILDHLYGGDYNCSIKLTVPTSSSTELPTTTLQLAFTVTGNPIPPPPPGGDLYVSGKIGIGVTNPQQELEVVGSVKVGAFEDPDESAINRLCADLVGKIVLCPTGYQPFIGNGYPNNPDPNGFGVIGNFTVPDGIFKINVFGRDLYVYPGQVIPVLFSYQQVTGGTSSFGTYSFGTYFSLMGTSLWVTY